MAKLVPDTIIDSQLAIFSAATILFICSDTPTTYGNASTTYKLASHVLTAEDFTVANGDSSGRKLTLAAQSGITVDSSGTATHYALGISASSTLLIIGTTSSQAVVAASTVNFPQTDVLEIRDLA